jgi:hypothetical protein
MPWERSIKRRSNQKVSKPSTMMLKIFPRLLAGSLVLNLLAACSSVPPQTGATVSPAPARSGYASVYIGRPPGGNVSIFPLPIHVDGRTAISLTPGEYTTLELPPGKHSIGVPDEAWTRAIGGIPHPVELAVEPGKTYYLLPSRRYEDAGYKFTVVGAAVVPDRTAVTHSSFSVQTAAMNAAPPAEFGQLAYVAAP